MDKSGHYPFENRGKLHRRKSYRGKNANGIEILFPLDLLKRWSMDGDRSEEREKWLTFCTRMHAVIPIMFINFILLFGDLRESAVIYVSAMDFI